MLEREGGAADKVVLYFDRVRGGSSRRRSWGGP